jgi:hypothetical protein
MSDQVIAYVPDIGHDTVCTECATDDEKEDENVATVILRSDEWANEAVIEGCKCSRCPKRWTGSIEKGEWK